MTLVSTCKGVDHIPEESKLKIDLKRTFGCKQAKGSSSLMWKGKYVKKFDFLMRISSKIFLFRGLRIQATFEVIYHLEP